MEMSDGIGDKNGALETVNTATTGESSSNPSRGTQDGLIRDAPEAGEAHVSNATRRYRVYKRRWFGLFQLTLLNIIVSWDVSATNHHRRNRLRPLQVANLTSLAVVNLLRNINDRVAILWSQ